MLSNLKAISIFRFAFFYFIFNFISAACSAQSLGDPIVSITFGAGTNKFGGSLPADQGETSYTYYENTNPNSQRPTFPLDGEYTITNTSSSVPNDVWVTTTDHTGDPGGYFMLVNAANTPGIFFTRTVTALCPGTKYQFGAFVKNMFSNGRGSLPNVTFQIETQTGTILGTYTTGNIAPNDTWNEYNTTFTTPANTGNIILKMINNGPGGYGNDLGIDDITFRPYGDPVQVVFDQSSVTQLCAGAPQTVVIKTTTNLMPGYAQKIQQQVNGVWTDMVTTVNGTQYSFTSPSLAGVYNYRVVSGLASNIANSQCVVASNKLVLTVLPQPVPAFTSPANACQNGVVAFQDNSSPNGAAIKAWLWNFGDGQTSTQQNPTHAYNLAGDYTVTLTVSNGNSCTSAPASKNIHINPLPVAAFTFANPACAAKPVLFTDNSIIPTGTTVTSRVWGMNGVTVNRPDNQPFSYTFSTAGTYAIQLTITLSTGCTSSIVRPVTVNALPVIDFDTPPTCISDNTVFTSHVTNPVSGAISYLWNFGDNSPASSAPNPAHKYQSTGNYTITLTVTNASGCSETLSKPFTVNGATPVADFTVLNKSTLCSSAEVVFQNKSDMAPGVFGSVTRIELYYDYDNNPTLAEVDNSPTPGKLYKHIYPEFHSGTKSYTIRMLAYSGGICVSQEKKDVITLLATPLVVFAPPAPVCASDGAIQLNAYDNSNSGIAGKGTYSGPGVSATGLFDPSKTGLGQYDVTYTYTFSATGCSNSISRKIIVNPIPTVEVLPSVTVLEGGQVVLNVKATGNGLTYAWSPATGLSDATVANPTVTGTADITYHLTVTNNTSCTTSADVIVTILKAPVVPNTFTPNGDGINDTWTVKYLESYPGCTVNIFNRYGQKVFTSTGYPVPWDGRDKNGNLPTGVYYYIIDPKNGRKPIAGYVTIIK